MLALVNVLVILVSLAADEMTPFRPRSPYGVAKAAAFWQVANYREAYQFRPVRVFYLTTNHHYVLSDLLPRKL